MKVQDVMSKATVSVRPDTAVRQLWKLLFTSHVNALPVLDKAQKIVGIISKEDLLKAMYPEYEELFADLTNLEDFEKMEEKIRELGSLTASQVMHHHVVFTREETPIMRALSRMIVRRLNQLPVVSDSGTLVGMITKGDIFYALVKREVKKEGQAENKRPVVRSKKRSKKK